MRRVVITGVAGMLGSHLVDRLMEEENTDVVGLDNLRVGREENIASHIGSPRFSFHKVDVLDLNSVIDLCESADIVVHFAALKKIGEDGPALSTLRTNSQGTENVLKAAKLHRARVLFASTSDVYGMSTDLPLREEGDLLIGPSMIKRWSYAVSKLYGEQLAFGYFKDEGVPVTIIRFFGAFSPRSSFSWSGGHVPLFVDAVLRDEPVIIHGDGMQTRSMAYVSDAVDGALLAMNCEAAIGEIVNIGTDEEVSVLDCAKLIHEVADTGRELKVEFVPLSRIFGGYKDIMRRVPDLRKARRMLGFQPRVRLRDAIVATIEARRRALG